MKKILSYWLHQDAYRWHHLVKNLVAPPSNLGAFCLSFILLLSTATVWAQDAVINGKVTDENGAGLIGATVRLKESSTIGTVTDVDGNYRLSVPQANNAGTLVFSYIGYLQEEILIGNQSTIHVQLMPDLETLSEVIVVGYGTQEKKDITGSIASVKGDEITSLPVPSISDALQGRASGMQVISTGQPGSDATFRIRGTGTINNSDPLLVIDGVPMQGGLNQLNPNDIASIEILKDASAAAIYGSRGANGVVIVTTKRGIAGKGQVNIDVYRGVQQATGTLDMLNATQFAAMHNEMMENNGQDPNPAFADPASLGAGTDWLGALLQTAPMQSYSASYSGGGEKSNFYVSGNVFDQEGIVIETGFRRYTLQLNTDTEVFDWLKFGNNLTLNHDIKKSGSYSIRNTMAALPTQAIYNTDGSYAGPAQQASWAGDIRNPIGEARLVDNTTKGYNLIGSIFGELAFLRNFTLRSNAGLQVNMWDSRTWSPKYNWLPTPELQSFLFQQSNRSITWLWDNTLTYDHYLGDDHHLTALLGTSAQSNRFDYINGSVKGFASDYTQQLGNGIEQPTLGGNASEWALLSFMGRVNYAFRDKYLITATLRRDGSSRFGEGNKWGMFPSGSVAWRLSEESFFDNQQLVSDLKLRAGYGVTGNQEIGNYSFASALNTIQYNFNNTIVSAVVPVVMPNPFVQWETVEQANVGLDAALFKSRVEISLDAYVKNTKDMLVPMAVPVSTGYSDVFVPHINAGKIQNKGIELAIGTINTTGKFKWDTDFNISYNKNKVISLNDTIPMAAGGIGFNYNLARIEAGRSINEFYGYVTNGLFQTEEDVENYAVQVPGEDPFNRTSPGDIRFLDLNNDGIINDDDRTYLGNPNPSFTFGLNNTFALHGFDLGIFLQGIYGNEIFNANRIWSEGMAVAQNQTVETLNRWTGPNTSNSMPRAVFNDPNKNTRASNRYIEDGSYLRIKNITLGYTLPESLVQRAKLSNVRLYASAQNLFTFTDYSGLDPEVPVNGIDLNLYPMVRTVSFGINVGF